MFLDSGIFPSQPQSSHFGQSFEIPSQTAQLTSMVAGDIPVNALGVTTTPETGSQVIPSLPLPLTSSTGLEGPHEMATPVFTNVPTVPSVGIPPSNGIGYPSGVSRMTRVSRSGSLTLPFERQPSFVAQNASGTVSAASSGPAAAFTPSDATDEGDGPEDEEQVN
jgi:hypothetical protein